MELVSDEYIDSSLTVFKECLIDERTYLIDMGESAIVIDPGDDDIFLDRLKKYKKIFVFLTHEHYDHICGVNEVRKSCECVLVHSSKICAEEVKKSSNCRLYPLLFINERETYTRVKKSIKLPYICTVDVVFPEDSNFRILDHEIKAWDSPGHSPGGMTYLFDNRIMFTGDNLLGNGYELKSVKANEKDLKRTIDIYARMDRNLIVCPGHGKINSLGYYIDKVKGYYKWS